MRIQGFAAGIALLAAIAATAVLGAIAVAETNHYPMATGATLSAGQQHTVAPQYPLQPILGQ